MDNLLQLRELNLGNNKIVKIEGLDKLSQLQKLYLRYNRITKIEGLENNSRLDSITLYGNKFPKMEGLDIKDAKAVVKYCRSAVEKRIINELELIKQKMNMPGITLVELESLKERVQELTKKLSD